MITIALMIPALITIYIRIKRNVIVKNDYFSIIFQYLFMCIFSNFVMAVIITYIMNIETDVYSLRSFSFFSKYVFCSSAFCFMWSYISEIVGKYINIKFEVTGKSNNGANDEKK